MKIDLCIYSNIHQHFLQKNLAFELPDIGRMKKKKLVFFLKINIRISEQNK